MGFIGSLLGIGGSNGANFQAQGTNLQQPTTSDQANQAALGAQQGLNQQQGFTNAVLGQNGLGNQANVFNQQQNLANQLQGVASGTGPNPALAQLNQTTGQNVANQAALMASQRGVGANPGLLARQAAMQGAGIQQQAAGQGATLAAQQQLAAMGQLQGQQANMANLASQQVGQQQGALNAFNSAQQGEQGQLLNSIAQQNQANVGMQSNINNANASIAQQNAKAQAGGLGGLLGGVGTALTGIPFNEGGTVPPVSHYRTEGQHTAGRWAEGGLVPSSKAGQFLSNKMSNGGMMAEGTRRVPGKPEVKGDSPKNDKVPAMLSPGEIVVPRSASSDPEKAAAFAKAVVMRNRKK